VDTRGVLLLSLRFAQSRLHSLSLFAEKPGSDDAKDYIFPSLPLTKIHVIVQ
jgi:hypothetical protein